MNGERKSTMQWLMPHGLSPWSRWLENTRKLVHSFPRASGYLSVQAHPTSERRLTLTLIRPAPKATLTAVEVGIGPEHVDVAMLGVAPAAAGVLAPDVEPAADAVVLFAAEALAEVGEGTGGISPTTVAGITRAEGIMHPEPLETGELGKTTSPGSLTTPDVAEPKTELKSAVRVPRVRENIHLKTSPRTPGKLRLAPRTPAR